jgi:hypothetical protein
MLKKFEEGRKDPFYYEAKLYGKILGTKIKEL